MPLFWFSFRGPLKEKSCVTSDLMKCLSWVKRKKEKEKEGCLPSGKSIGLKDTMLMCHKRLKVMITRQIITNINSITVNYINLHNNGEAKFNSVDSLIQPVSPAASITVNSVDYPFSSIVCWVLIPLNFNSFLKCFEHHTWNSILLQSYKTWPNLKKTKKTQNFVNGKSSLVVIWVKGPFK